ncbi:MAG: hypothetical protein IKT52_05550 [Oscillospiraceae bacterium]|nr:hypothetical protein [Oscillospiraceae bacterium]
MIIRNGIRSTLRARGRSLLFTLLILVLTLALTLGIGAWAYSSALLSQMEAGYTSIALVEYLGQDYPDADVADVHAREAAGLLDSDAISKIDGVQLWETNSSVLAAVEGYKRESGEVPYPDQAVFVCTLLTPFMVEGLVDVAEEDLPAERVIIREEAGLAMAQKSSSRKTGWLELYTYTAEGYVRAWKEDGKVVQTTVTKEELPANCIVQYGATRNTASGSGMRNYFRYFRNGKETWRIPEDHYNQYTPEYFYDEATGTYTGYGKVAQSYTGICVDALYDRDFEGEKLISLMADYDGLEINKKSRYLVHGTFTRSGGKVNAFSLMPFYEGCETEPWLELTAGTEIPEIFYQYADMYEKANRYVRFETSADVEALEVFQQNVLRLQEGRFPETGEAGTCVVSYDIAQQLELALGDTIDLSVLRSAEDDRFYLSSGSESRTLTVVGITTQLEEYYGCVWASDAEYNYETQIFGYALGRAVLANSTARQSADAIAALCPDNVRVTLYDQGYSAAAQPLQTMQTTAMAITLAAACSTFAVLLLFAYLFVGRQKETVQVLVCLGTPRRKIRRWLLSGAVVICGAAAAGGAALGNFGLSYIIDFATRITQAMYEGDLRYSEAAIGFVKETAFTQEIPRWPAVYAGVAVFAAALVLCALFLQMARRQTVAKRGKQRIHVPRGGTSTMGRGALRFASLSARRGGWRSVVVPLVSLMLVLLLGLLAITSAGWSQQLDDLYRDARISGKTVSTNGRQNTNLQIAQENVRKIYKSGLLESLEVSIGWNYWFADEIPEYGDYEYDIYRKELWVSRQPQLVALNGLGAAPEFMHAQLPEITWLDGWDESFLESRDYHAFTSTLTYFQGGKLLKPENEPMRYPCIVSQTLMERRGLELGDELTVMMTYEHQTWEGDIYVQLTVVGSFPQVGGRSNIYVPLGFWSSPDWVFGQEDMKPSGDRLTMAFETPYDRDYFLYATSYYETCVFTLSDAVRLEELRDYFQSQSFSQVGKMTRNRTTIMLSDQTFVETVEGLNRYISFGRILFPVLFAVVMLLGFIISWLVINSRRMEFAVLRGLGTSKLRVFLSFFLEQCLLCMLGCALALAVLYVSVPDWLVHLQIIGVYLGCYLFGTAISVHAVGRTHLMSLLSERE